ncbi:hypothetical protein HK098_001855 [Nowakowskiella sp. JEL0407]|nr:hypothetical protein HK098_001855 [Nowakowskiella sp. JEL0407]
MPTINGSSQLFWAIIITCPILFIVLSWALYQLLRKRPTNVFSDKDIDLENGASLKRKTSLFRSLSRASSAGSKSLLPVRPGDVWARVNLRQQLESTGIGRPPASHNSSNISLNKGPSLERPYKVIAIQDSGWLGGSNEFDRSLPKEQETTDAIPERTASLAQTGSAEDLDSFGWDSTPHRNDIVVAVASYANKRKDEISVKIGDPISIYYTFPDAWVMCMNWRSGLSGMCPMSILDPEECVRILINPEAQKTVATMVEERKALKKMISQTLNSSEESASDQRPRSRPLSALKNKRHSRSGSVISVNHKRSVASIQSKRDERDLPPSDSPMPFTPGKAIDLEVVGDNIEPVIRKVRPASISSRRSSAISESVPNRVTRTRSNSAIVPIVYDEKPHPLGKRATRQSLILTTTLTQTPASLIESSKYLSESPSFRTDFEPIGISKGSSIITSPSEMTLLGSEGAEEVKGIPLDKLRSVSSKMSLNVGMSSQNN